MPTLTTKDKTFVNNIITDLETQIAALKTLTSVVDTDSYSPNMYRPLVGQSWHRNGTTCTAEVYLSQILAEVK